MKYLLLFLLTLPAFADVVSCKTGITGASTNCGGCTTVAYQPPGYDIFVKTDASTAWTPFQNLKPTDSVYVGTTGTACSAAVKTLVSALGSVPPVTPPEPPPVDPPIPQNGSLVVTWTASTLNTDGTPAHVTGYHVRWNGAATSEFITGNVLTYTIVGPPGAYQITVAAIDATSESAQSNSVTGTIAATGPPDPPPVTVTEVLGTWTLKKGTANILTGLPDYAACKDQAIARATTTSTKYLCNVSHSVTVKQ